jgi:hypothetical protein
MGPAILLQVAGRRNSSARQARLASHGYVLLRTHVSNNYTICSTSEEAGFLGYQCKEEDPTAAAHLLPLLSR